MALSSFRLLMMFDFDQTIINCNVDVWIRKLLPNGKVPPETKRQYKEHNDWTRYMADIFAIVHEQGVQKSTILESLDEVPLIPGMVELFKYQEAAPSVDTIITSDANTLFIGYIMERAGLGGSYSEIFSNPAQFGASGRVGIRHHHQHNCATCPPNLCKGTVLREYLRQKCDDGLVYDAVAVVGDGSNDFCPCLGLREKDVVFPRRGYKLMQLIDEHNRSADQNGTSGLKATVVPWNNAHEILQYVQKMVET